MTPAERAAAWSTLSWRLRQAEATEDAGASAHYARLALEAYEALRADDEAKDEATFERNVAPHFRTEGAQ